MTHPLIHKEMYGSSTPARRAAGPAAEPAGNRWKTLTG